MSDASELPATPDPETDVHTDEQPTPPSDGRSDTQPAAPADAQPAAQPNASSPERADAELDEVLATAVAELIIEHGHTPRIEGRTILLNDVVSGTLHLAALQALGYAAAAAPVGAVAHGPGGVAAAVWIGPELYICRWTGPTRWVSKYRFPNRTRPDTYVRDDTGIPSHLAKGSWYGEVPDEVAEAFFAVGILLDEPPFPVPQPPPPPPRSEPATKRSSTSGSSAPRAPRAPRPKAPPAPKKVVAATRTCMSCFQQKHPDQFVEGSDLCIDCR